MLSPGTNSKVLSTWTFDNGLHACTRSCMRCGRGDTKTIHRRFLCSSMQWSRSGDLAHDMTVNCGLPSTLCTCET
eukprot:4619947-Amphidinium_carterae.1